MPVSDITDEVIENTFNRVVQSHKDFVIEEGVAVNVIAMEDQRGGGRKKYVSARVTVMENIKHDSNIMCPPMDSGDEMCLARCLTYGMIWHRHQGPHRARDLRRLCDNGERWTCESHSLCVSAGVERHVPAGQDALEKFETHLRPQGFTIRAFTLDHQDHPLFFKCYPREGTKVVDVVLVNGHYMFIKKVARYFNKDYFCNLCCTPFDRRMCSSLRASVPSLQARDVHRVSTLRGTHVSVSRVQALLFWNTVLPSSFGSEWECPYLWRYCEECHHEYQHDARHAHKCGERYCKVCNAIRPQEHRCFVPVRRFRRLRARRSYDRGVVLHPIVKPWICWTRSWYRGRLTIVSTWSFLTLKPSKKRVNISLLW